MFLPLVANRKYHLVGTLNFRFLSNLVMLIKLSQPPHFLDILHSQHRKAEILSQDSIPFNPMFTPFLFTVSLVVMSSSC